MADDFDAADQMVKDVVEESHLTYQELRSKDGLLTRSGGRSQSLLHRAMSVGSIVEELKTALFKTVQEPDQAVAALWDAYEKGLYIEPILWTMVARNADINHGYIRDILNTISTTTLNTNYQKDKDSGRRSKGSPLET